MFLQARKRDRVSAWVQAILASALDATVYAIGRFDRTRHANFCGSILDRRPFCVSIAIIYFTFPLLHPNGMKIIHPSVDAPAATLGRRKIKNNSERVGSIPDITFVEINFIPFQEFPKLILKRNHPVIGAWDSTLSELMVVLSLTPRSRQTATLGWMLAILSGLLTPASLGRSNHSPRK